MLLLMAEREGVPATCPSGGVTADSHGLSRITCQQIRRSANLQVAAVVRHRLPKLMATEQQRRRRTSDLRGPIRWGNAQVALNIGTASDDFERP